MAVIGGHHGNAKLFFQSKKISMNAMLFRQPLVLNFHEEVVFAKEITVKSSSGTGRVILAFKQVFTHLACQAAAQSDEPLGMFRQKLFADARLVIEAVHA